MTSQSTNPESDVQEDAVRLADNALHVTGLVEIDNEAAEEDRDLQDPNWGQPYRDGKVHVMAERCGTCVFHPGNRMHLNPGRLADMAANVKETGVPFSCHQTLSYSEDKYKAHYDGNALCRGAVDAYGDQSTVMRMAHAVGIIEEVEPYPYNPDDPHGHNSRNH